MQVRVCADIHCVSKNIPNIFRCNSRKHCQISYCLAHVLPRK